MSLACSVLCPHQNRLFHVLTVEVDALAPTMWLNAYHEAQAVAIGVGTHIDAA